jgi:hypothetical protein
MLPLWVMGLLCWSDWHPEFYVVTSAVELHVVTSNITFRCVVQEFEAWADFGVDGGWFALEAEPKVWTAGEFSYFEAEVVGWIIWADFGADVVLDCCVVEDAVELPAAHADEVFEFCPGFLHRGEFVGDAAEHDRCWLAVDAPHVGFAHLFDRSLFGHS